MKKYHINIKKRLQQLLTRALLKLHEDKVSFSHEIKIIMKEVVQMLGGHSFTFFVTNEIKEAKKIVCKRSEYWTGKMKLKTLKDDIIKELQDAEPLSTWHDGNKALTANGKKEANGTRIYMIQRQDHVYFPINNKGIIQAVLVIEKQSEDPEWSQTEAEVISSFAALLYSAHKVNQSHIKQQERIQELISDQCDKIEEYHRFSHQLKNPLAVIKINAELISQILRKTENDDLSEFDLLTKVERIERGVELVESVFNHRE